MDASTILVYICVPAWAALLFLSSIADDVCREDALLRQRFESWKRDEKHRRQEQHELELREEARRRRPRNVDSPFITHDDEGDGDDVTVAEPA